MEQLIISYYNAILRVDPTQDQIDLWLNLIDPNDPEPGIEDLTDALCFQADEVLSIMRIYQVVLGRVPDSGGLDFWVQVFRDIQDANPGLSYREALVETIRDWLSSDEFLSVYGGNLSDEDYVAILYINVLNRPPDPEGFNFWVNELKSGAITREGLVIAFSESEEFKMMVDAEAKGILLYDAQTSSNDDVDDPAYEIPGGDPYQGELQNEAPIDIIIGTDVDENAANGTVVNEGQLTAVDPDGGETFTWELVDDAGGAFELDDPNAQQPNIVVADGSLLDHEANPTMTVRVRVTDSRGNTYEEDVVIDINDINEAPHSLTPPGPLAIDEQDGSLSNPGVGGAVVAAFSATDPDGDPLVFSVEDSSLAGALTFVGNNLVVANAALIDSEAGVASIDVLVRATDPDGLFTEQWVTVNVNPLVDEDPTDILPDALDVAANTPPGLTLTDLVATDPDTSPDSHTFVITNDPTGGGFGIDLSGTKLVLADPTRINSTNLVDNGQLDTDGLLNGLVVFDIEIEVTDSNGNSYTDTIQVTVDQNGLIIPFTDVVVEVLDGTEGDDVFTANAGVGPGGPVPGINQTANAGDIANGEGGDDLLVLTKQNNAVQDFARPVTGVTLNDIEGILIINRDQSPLPPAPTLPILDDVCTPCINMPVMASALDDPVVFEATLSPDLDHVAFGQSLASVGIWDLQADFWTIDPADANDLGPIVDVFDVTANWVWVDSDPQSKAAGVPIDELVFTVDEVLINELRITENASGNEPGGPRSEQVGTIRIAASGVPSVVGSINNGWPGGLLLPGWPGTFPSAVQPTTHTLAIEVGDLTGTSPTSAVGPAAAAANTAAIDFFAGQVDGIGAGLPGLEDVVITGGGDVFLVFDSTTNDTNSDAPADTFPLEIVDGAGSGFFFFEEGGFAGVRIDGGDGFDTVGVFRSELAAGGPGNIVDNVERVKLLDAAFGTIFLHQFTDELTELVLSAGVSGGLTIRNIPDLSQEGATIDQSLLRDDFGTEGFVVNIDQCCFDAPGNPPVLLGDLPLDFDMRLDADGGNTARVATIFNVDPGGPGGSVTVDSLLVHDIDTYHLNVTDCDNATDGLFEIRFFGSEDQDLRTLLITGNSGENFGTDTTKILQDPPDPGGANTTPLLTLIKGTGDLRNQHFLEFDAGAGGQLADLKIMPVLEAWGDDFLSTVRPAPVGRMTEAANIINDLIVSDDGAVADLGDGNDIYSGNRDASGGVDDRGADFIRGNDGVDLLFGAVCNDQIEGGSGDDEIHGEEGEDSLYGDQGDDLIIAQAGNDYADGGTEDDIIFGGSGEDTLRGGTGDDVLCGDDGDDCLHGEEGDDLLIGGEGDDFLDAGSSGVDMLIGDYGCDPCYAHVTIPDADLEEGDAFTIGIDTTGDGVVDATFTTVVGDPLFVGGGDVLAHKNWIAFDLASRIQNFIDNVVGEPECWDVSWENGIVTICKVGDEIYVEGSAVDAAIPSVHKSELDGQIGDGDEFTWDITWSGANPGPNETYTYKYDASDVKWNGVISPDGVIDTIAELKALADDIAADFAINKGADLADFTMEVDANGLICLIGPDDKSGETPTVAVSAVDDGALADIPETPQVTCIDFGSGAGFEDMGDVVVISFAAIAPNPYGEYQKIRV